MVLFSSCRMDLHLEVARELDANATEPERMTAIQPDRNFDDKLFYSKDKRIYSSNIGQRNSRLILTTDEEIVSFQQINVETYLVREKSSVKLYSTGKKTTKELTFMDHSVKTKATLQRQTVTNRHRFISDQLL